MYFYPRPLRGGRLQLEFIEDTPSVISIHALCEEGDLPVKPKRRGDVKFLSTPSARRATSPSASLTV